MRLHRNRGFLFFSTGEFGPKETVGTQVDTVGTPSRDTNDAFPSSLTSGAGSDWQHISTVHQVEVGESAIAERYVSA